MELLLLIMIVPFFIYWCVDEKIGVQVGIAFLLAIWFMFIYRHFNDKLSFFISLRLIAAAVISIGFVFLRKPIDSLLSKGGYRAYMITAAVFSFIMIIYRPSLEAVLPGGLFLGMGTGYCLNKKYIGFKSSDVLERDGVVKFFTLLARFVIGMAVLAVIVFRIESIMHNYSGSQNIFLYGFLCYAITSFWVFVAAPWIFIKLRLAGAYVNAAVSEQPEVKNEPKDQGNE